MKAPIIRWYPGDEKVLNILTLCATNINYVSRNKLRIIKNFRHLSALQSIQHKILFLVAQKYQFL